MNTLLFHDFEVSNDGLLKLGEHDADPRAEHICGVLRPSPGAFLRVGQIGGLLGTGEVLECVNSKESLQPHSQVKLRINNLNVAPPAKHPLHLILALPRPKSLRRILRGLANFGVTSLDLIQSYRVEKSYWSAPVLEPAKLESALLEGLSIANDTILPTVQLHRRFKPYVEDAAAALSMKSKLIAHPQNNLHQSRPVMLDQKHGSPVALAVGPEGGWTDYEVGLFRKAGFEQLSLGPRILSVEVALPVLGTALFFDLQRITNG
jgi:16S rRNA (uracil1498-N3)-methyltransferase